jgi:hypothetical protein
MPTLTGPTVIQAVVETAINTLFQSAAYSVPSNAIRADVELYVAYVGTTAPLSPPNNIVIQTCNSATDDSQWVDNAPFSGSTTTAATTTANGAISAAATSVTLTNSGTFGSRSTLLYFKDSTTAGEWVQAQGQATTTLTVPAPGVVNSHLTGINIYDQALRFYCSLDVSCIKRVRIKVDNNVAATGPTVAVYASVTTYAN